MWGGRFSKPLDERALIYTTSLPIDRRLLEWDVLGSVAHARMLGRQGIIPATGTTAPLGSVIGTNLREHYAVMMRLVRTDPAAKGEAASVEQLAGPRPTEPKEYP